MGYLDQAGLVWAWLYHLWRQRNAILHSGNVYTEEQLISIIKKDVKGRIEIINHCCAFAVKISLGCL